MYENLSKEQVLEIMKEKDNKINRNLRRLDFDIKFINQCQKLFGSWKDAVYELAKSNPYQREKYTIEEILKNSRRFVFNRKRIPKESDFNGIENYNEDIIFYYGSFENFQEELRKDKHIFEFFNRDREEIIGFIKLFIKQNDCVPSKDDIYKELKISKKHFKEIFINLSWDNFLIEECNATYDQINRRNTLIKDSKEQLLKGYIDLCHRIGKEASCDDIDKDPFTYSADIYIRQFGTMKELKKMAGAEYREPNLRYTLEKILDEMKFQYRLNKCGRLTIEKIDKNKLLPTLYTILRYFKRKSISDVWDIIEEKIEEEDKLLFTPDTIKWNATQEMFLKKYYHNHWNKDIAKCLKKNVKSIEKKAFIMKLKKDNEFKSIRKDINMETVNKLREDGLSNKQIARMLKMGESTFYKKMKEIEK